MIKKIIFLGLISFCVTSCSTYNNFNKRKYFDFHGKSSDVEIENEGKLQTKESLVFFENELEASNDNVLENVIKKSNHKKESISLATQNCSVYSKQETGEKGAVTQNVKKYTKRKFIKALPEYRKGKYWWVAAIFAFVFIILSLFISAYLFLFLALVEIVIAIIYLIKYIKSK